MCPIPSSGDPQLHDHVVVWNRAKSTSDGGWRPLDSRGLFKTAVMLSERHQGVLSDRSRENSASDGRAESAATPSIAATR